MLERGREWQREKEEGARGGVGVRWEQGKGGGAVRERASDRRKKETETKRESERGGGEGVSERQTVSQSDSEIVRTVRQTAWVRLEKCVCVEGGRRDCRKLVKRRELRDDEARTCLFKLDVFADRPFSISIRMLIHL